MGFSLIGMVPKYHEHLQRGDVIDVPRIRYSDAIRHLRCDLIRRSSGVAVKVILITCATPDERKDELCMDLAASFAQSGKKMLLVESDIKRSLLRGSNSMPRNETLTEEAFNTNANTALVSHPRVPSLFVLPAGSSPHNLSELGESQRMRQLLREWRETFDIIIIDAPPVILFTDARLLSEMADLTVQVAKYRAATRTSVQRAHDLLSKHANGNVEIVLTGVPKDSTAYHNYYVS
jgi:capsular exopolysaccharide synthesis family protein